MNHLQEEGVVEDDLGGGDAQLEYAIVDCLGGLQSAQALLQVTVECPQLEAPIEPVLDGALPLLLCLLMSWPRKGSENTFSPLIQHFKPRSLNPQNH